MPYTRRRRSTGRSRTPGYKFQAKAGTRRTTEFKQTGGSTPLQRDQNWHVIRIPLIQGSANRISRIGGLKITARLADTTNGDDNACCLGVLKATQPETIPWLANPDSLLSDAAVIRRIFGKETWVDIGGFSPTLVQRSIRGMLTLSQGQDLALVAMITTLGGSAATLLLKWVAEWSERDTTID